MVHLGGMDMDGYAPLNHLRALLAWFIPEFPVRAGNENIASLERTSEVAICQAQHGRNNGAYTLAIGAVMQLIFQL
jgi:hypothetical protein